MAKNSSSFRPDLDWTQVRETSKLLNLSAGQVDDLLNRADASVDTLTDAFTSIVEHMQAPPHLRVMPLRSLYPFLFF